MMYGFKKSREFRENIDPLEEWPVSVAIKQAVRKTAENHYTMRLFLKSKGPLGAFVVCKIILTKYLNIYTRQYNILHKLKFS